MLKFWIRLYKDGKIKKDYVCDVKGTTPGEMLEEGLKEACYALDLSNPIIMKKHINDMREYSLTRFLPADFPESVDFDKADVNIFDDSKNKKRK